MTTIGTLILSGLGIYFSGILGVLIFPKKHTSLVLIISGGGGSLILMAAGAVSLFSPDIFSTVLWTIPGLEPVTVTVDHLSAFFLIAVSLAAFPASIFAASRIHGVRSALYLGLLISLAPVVITADVFSFLAAWEIMSIFLYLLINSGKEERPGYLMLALGEAGTLAVLAALLLLAGNTGGLSFHALKVSGMHVTPGLQWTVFILSFFGFGVKAGLIPVNFWLPKAYAAAPPAVIPLIAGATLNLGLYGIIRINTDLLPVHSTGMGIVVLVTGAVTALIGILYATIEDDLKTLLAHSSIENAGIMTTALGAGMIFLATGYKGAAAIAFIASFYHLLNHSVYKTLLFIGAGAVEESTGLRSLDRMGGLLKTLQWTGFFMLIGVLSISAIPPFNGFVSEWLTLQSLLRSVELASLGIKIVFVAAGAVLALTAGLTVTCFVRAFSMGFLGIPRTEKTAGIRKAGKTALVSMAFLALVSLSLGVLPTYVIPDIDKAVSPLTGANGSTALIPPFFNNAEEGNELPQYFVSDFHAIGAQIGKGTLPGRGLVVMHRGGKKNPVVFAMSTSYLLIMLFILLSLTFLIVKFATRHRKTVKRPRWDGGIRNLLPEMTYTATGFAQPVRVIFNTILRPKVADHREVIVKHFREAIHRERKEVHLIDKLVLYPLSSASMWTAEKLARMHSGRVNSYAGYALFILILFLVIASFI